MRPTALLALLLAAPVARAQECPPTPGGRGYRPAMTHRAPGAEAAAGISVATLQAWSPPAAADDDAARGRDAVIDPREQRAATLEGDVWRVKVGDDGCALTLELTATRAGRDAPHVVAVIPAGDGYAAARAAITAAAGRVGGRRWRRGELAAPVHVRLTGYVFWDGAHWCRENPGRGCGHRTAVVASLWELRPVWRAEVIDDAGGGDDAPVAARDDDGGHHGHRGRRGHRPRAQGRRDRPHRHRGR